MRDRGGGENKRKNEKKNHVSVALGWVPTTVSSIPSHSYTFLLLLQGGTLQPRG